MDVSKPEFTIVDLFAGCGGLSLGMEQAGFVPVFVNELNHDAMATYLANRRVLGQSPVAEREALRCHDAHDLEGERLEQLVADLTSLGLEFPSLDETRRGVGASSLDLVAGGPPCQGYSGIGHRRSYGVNKEDMPANQLYDCMARVIERLRPRIFLFENVKGLLSSRWTPGGDEIWPVVRGRFERIGGYQVRWSLVRSSDYGVPQNRPRVLMVGIREDVLASVKHDADAKDAVKCGFLPQGRASPPDLETLLGDLVDDEKNSSFATGDYPPGKFETRHYPRPPDPDVHDEYRRYPDGREVEFVTDHEYSKHSRRVLDKFRYMLKHREIPEWGRTRKFGQRVLLPRWDRSVGPTITATSLPDDYVHFAQPRILTVREWARLQTFPDWYEFKGKRTTGGLRRAGNPREGIFEREVPKYTQIGNAVPPRLARCVGKHFIQIIRQARQREEGMDLPASSLREMAA